MNRKCVFYGACILFTWQAAAQNSAFEVVSIKPNTSDSANGGMGPRGASFVATNVTLKTLVSYAFSSSGGLLLKQQLIGLPAWASSDRFDIEAKPGSGDASALPAEKTKTMVQQLLEDRFGLTFHRKTRDLPVYNLIVAGKTLTRSKDQTPPDRTYVTYASQAAALSSLPRGALQVVQGATSTTIRGTAITLPHLVTLLQGPSDRMIIDKTEVRDLIDINVDVNRNDVAPSSPLNSEAVVPTEAGQSLFTAVQEIGVKLIPAKAMLEVIVIESVRHPSAN